MMARKRWGLPYVITEVNTGFGTGRVREWEAAVSRRAFAGAEAVIAISQNLRARLEMLGGARRVEVIPCTVDEAYWTLPPTPQTAAPFTFYGQAHLSPRKEFDLLIRTFARRSEATRAPDWSSEVMAKFAVSWKHWRYRPGCGHR